MNVNSQRQPRARAPTGSDAAPTAAPVQPVAPTATEAEPRQWVEQTSGGAITKWQMIAGGNRCRSWAVDVTHTSDANGAGSDLHFDFTGTSRAATGPMVVIVEQRVIEVLEIADEAHILDHGRFVRSGPARAMLTDPMVQETYMGL
jgi:hypothetical protein